MPKQLAPRLISWASILDPQTEAQAIRAASMPFIHPHIALMPDAHLGKGATVGSVIPTERAIIPAAVGVDIGCGMIAVRTQFQGAELSPHRAPLRKAIEASIPLGAGAYNTRIWRHETSLRIADLESLAVKLSVPVDSFAANWRDQLGSLGSGNHFIEVSVDQDDHVWLFLHSGSRGVGNKIAQHHIAQAQDLMKTSSINLPDRDLAYFVEGTEHFDHYMAGLTWAQEFARLNRAEMMARVKAAFEKWIGGEIRVEREVNCHHNYTAKEPHFGRDVWLSRKGAIDASPGTWGLIPGSMGTPSYVVLGKGNRLALNSAPHGAGRNYSRTAARKRFTVEQLREAMAGIEYRDTAAFIDEIPQAYKPIDVVMEDARDLVDVRYELRQIVNVKGD
jgi:tRNA-splicing ligase RtcB (3'-phosphate/5'-hydroxy nucleic acid ligase)